jgi:hypothetical protein
MLLNDIGTVPNTKFRKINQYLETNYGFKLAEDIDGKNLEIIVEQIQDEITQLKIQGGDAKESPEISKRLMILEGIRSLNEFAMIQSYHKPEFESVVSNLSNYVNDSVKLGDEMEDAIRQAMKEYRSSRYRFPDEVVESNVRANCNGQFQPGMPSMATQGAPSGVPTMGVMEDDTAEEDESMKESDIEESDKWIQGAHVDQNKGGLHKALHVPQGEKIPKAKVAAATHSDNPHVRHMAQFAKNVSEGPSGTPGFANAGKRASALGGHPAEVPNTPQAKHAMKALNNPSLSLAPQSDDEQVPMVRNPNTGRMQPDPFAAHAAARKKGIAMKESGNLVKHLRALLETEVSQAEVMMAAKGFAQELQEMVEKIGRLQNEDLPPVTDQMRETYGMESASAFQTQIYGALQSVMDALYTAKGQVDDAVGNMAATGQFDAGVDMDKDVGMAMDADPGMDGDLSADTDLDLDNLGDELEGDAMGDEFGGAEEEQPLGREKKMESAAHLKKKIAEMKRIVEKAKRLKEATR